KPGYVPPFAVPSEAIDFGDPTGAYLSQVGQIPLLNHDEEIDLAKRIELGAKARHELARVSASSQRHRELQAIVEDSLVAHEHLILANSRLVISVAKKYRGQGIPFRDLMQEGHIGMMRAVKKFDHRRGFKFSTYATWWIRQAISRTVSDQGRTVRIPVHMGDKIRKVLRTRHRLTQKLGTTPSVDEVADSIEAKPEEVRRILRYSERTASLDKPLGEDNAASLGEIIEDEQAPMPEKSADGIMMEEDVHRALEALSPREEQVLRLRHGMSKRKPLTLDEIGRQIGVTRERVRQIEGRAIQRLRNSEHRQVLEEHLTNL
ncbi:MAG: RNA polymerase sigma factor RpoD/SigA, partial [Bacteroidota bacterium]